MTSTRVGPRWVPPLLLVISCTASQASAAFAHHGFASIGALSVSAWRFTVAALCLLLISRPSLRGRSASQWAQIFAFGGSIAWMNSCFYQAVARMPLGNVTSIEFLGPFAIAVVGARGWREARWVGLAAVGVVILSHPGSGATWSGVAFAAAAAAGWAAYTLLSKRVGARTEGWEGLALSVAVAALLLSPFSISAAPQMSAPTLGWVAASAVSGVVLAFALELQALRLAPARTVSVFFSFDPVAAFAVGVVLLNQPIGWSAAFGATCVVVASIAVARHERPDEPAPQLAPG